MLQHSSFATLRLELTISTMAEIGAADNSTNAEKPAITSPTTFPDITLHSRDRSPSNVNNGSRDHIDWRYLKFDTPLPSPNPTSTKHNAAPPALPPDLSRLDNPMLWSKTHKWIAVVVSSFGCMMVAYASAAYASAITQLEQEFDVSFDVANLGITFYNIGFGVTPMLCAPLSESIGRYYVFTISGAIFVIAQIFCGVTRSFPGLVLARLLAGCGGSTFSTIVGGVISDVFAAEGRNAPMSVFSSTTLDRRAHV